MCVLLKETKFKPSLGLRRGFCVKFFLKMHFLGVFSAYESSFLLKPFSPTDVVDVATYSEIEEYCAPLGAPLGAPKGAPMVLVSHAPPSPPIPSPYPHPLCALSREFYLVRKKCHAYVFDGLVKLSHPHLCFCCWMLECNSTQECFLSFMMC